MNLEHLPVAVKHFNKLERLKSELLRWEMAASAHDCFAHTSAAIYIEFRRASMAYIETEIERLQREVEKL